jgi:hypothetical protein
MECLLQSSLCLNAKNLEGALTHCNLAAVVSALALEGGDNHFKQATITIERCQSLAKKKLKELYTKEAEKRFADILGKIKKGNLSKEEKVTPEIPPVLQTEL